MDVESTDDQTQVVQNDDKNSSDDSSFDEDDSDSSEDEDGDKKSSRQEMDDKDPDLDEDDPVIKSIQAAREKKKANHPPDLDLSPHSPSCMSFHQSEDILTVATFDGDLRMYSYSDEANTLIGSVSLEEGRICREVTYTTDGDKIMLASCGNGNDLHIYDVKEGLRLDRRIKQATTAAVSSLYSIDENTFATGDDDGYLLLWDLRTRNSYANLKVSEDCISSMITSHEKRLLACTATDGSLFAVRIRGGSIDTQSEIYESEFNCIGLFKQESKIAVGNGQGSVYVFNWNEFGRHADIYTGIGAKTKKKKPEAINALIPITERIILTGGEDGCIRAMNFYPQKYLGLVGQVPYSIEKMDVCNDGHLIASIGSDEEVIKFWNVSYFESMTVGKKEKVKHKSKPTLEDESKSNLPSSSKQNAADFYGGLV
ncbi:WD repeat-containing protein 55 homolog isoform X2 [Folsomia candida]|nr:WD repeat-containing protein 55 homolog isoform X2 [Folsomia candida]